MITSIEIRKIRCFDHSQRIQLKPLTLLVGENSSGKSTFLSCIDIACRMAKSIATPDFNKEPYELGAFDQIARKTSATIDGDERKFSLGCEILPSPDDRKPVYIYSEFRREGSQPQLLSWGAVANTTTVDIENMYRRHGLLRIRANEIETTVPFRHDDRTSDQPITSILTSALFRQELRSTEDTAKLINRLSSFYVLSSIQQPISVAPIRSRALRTYNPSSKEHRPEGQHIPMLLSGLTSKRRQRVLAILEQFGARSGLLKKFELVIKGNNDSDPFQLMVAVEDLAVNLLDVGYGVSQVLPILVETILASKGTTFLVQQPEVHLHPRAQAELGTFFSQISAGNAQQFIIETHSDYLIDRVRMEIREGNMNPTDVALLYFERRGDSVEISPIEIDRQGELVRTPEKYRDFFLNEQRRFILGP